MSVSFLFLSIPRHLFVAEALMNKDLAQHMFSVDQMIENDYPVPMYLADVFQYTPDWRLTAGMPTHKIYAIDCKMVRSTFSPV